MRDFVGWTAEYRSITTERRITEGLYEVTKAETHNKIERF
jgi:hypothetical protein